MNETFAPTGKHKLLANVPDSSEAEGPFEARPEWMNASEDDDTWEVSRPTTERGKRTRISPAPVATCRDREMAEAVRDALNAFTSTPADDAAETVTVPRDALKEILLAFIGPGYLLNELLAISAIREDCPIKRLTEAYDGARK